MCDCQPAVVIAAVTVCPPTEDGAEPEFVNTPMFVSVTPGIKLVDHDAREA